MLADSPANIPLKSMVINGTRSVQKDKGIRAATATNRDRGNRETEVSFETSRGFADQNAAETFLLMHETLLPDVLADVTITFAAGVPGKTSTRYMVGAVLTNSGSRMAGATTFHNYKIVGPEMLTSLPATT